MSFGLQRGPLAHESGFVKQHFWVIMIFNISSHDRYQIIYIKIITNVEKVKNIPVYSTYVFLLFSIRII